MTTQMTVNLYRHIFNLTKKIIIFNILPYWSNRNVLEVDLIIHNTHIFVSTHEYIYR